MPEPEGPEDERFVYVVTAAGVEALRAEVVAMDSEWKATPPWRIGQWRLDAASSGADD